MAASSFYSNRFNLLAERLGKELFDQKAHIFQKRFVIVPSLAMKDYLVHYFIDHPDYRIFAGVRILPLHEAMTQLLALLFPEQSIKIPSRLELSLRIEQILSGIGTQEEMEILKPVLEYVQKGEKRISFLSDHLSSLFSQYGLYGKSFLKEFLNTPSWQQWIWERTYGKDTGWSFSLEALSLPFRPRSFSIHLFGFSTLADIYLDFFNRLRASYYILSPCMMFWEDLLSDRERIGSYRKLEKKQVAKRDLDAWEGFVLDTHPLLANWGKIGRDFLRSFEAFELLSDEDHRDPLTESSLALVQKEILHLEPIEEKEKDRSIQIHPASSWMEEIEILYDEISSLIATSQIEPKDILVLASDLDLYAPFIQAVFGAEKSPLLFSLEGIHYPPSLESFSVIQQILALPSLEFSSEAILELLRSKSLCKKWQFSKEDIKQIAQLIERLQIRFGLSGRDVLGSWENGLDRLLLGFFMELDPDSVLEMPDLLLPSEIARSVDLNLIDRFVQWFRCLIQDLGPILRSEKKTLHQWFEFLNQIASSHLSLSDEERNIFSDLYSLRLSFPQEDRTLLNASVVDRILDAFCKKGSKTMFMHNAQRIRFRNLQSGNVTQAKVIWLLGMDEMSFPKRGNASSLCLLKGHSDYKKIPQRVEEDRYLLLESLTLAQECLIASYQKIDADDGKEKNLSLALQELFVSFRDSKEIKEDPIETFESDAPLAVSPFKKNLIENPHSLSLPLPAVIDLHSLQKLAKDPIRFHCEEVLGIKIAPSEEEEEQFLLSSLMRAIFRKSILRHSSHLDFSSQVKAQLKIWQAEGKLPVGMFEKIAVRDLQKQVEEFEEVLKGFSIRPQDFFSIEFSSMCTEPILSKSNHWILPPCSIEIGGGLSFDLVGVIDSLTPHGLLFHGDDKIFDWIRLWPLLLVLGHLENLPFPFEYRVLFLKSGKMKEIDFIKEKSLMANYLQYYLQALEQFVPFMPEWMPSLLEKTPLELKKAIQQSLNHPKIENPYLRWVDKQQEGWNADEIFASWAPYAKHVFSPLVQLGAKEGIHAL